MIDCLSWQPIWYADGSLYSLVASGGDPSPQIAKAATQTIPIVFGMFGDPVKEGLVDSLSRPGAAVTTLGKSGHRAD